MSWWSCCSRVIRSRNRQSLAFAEIADQPFVGLHAGSALHHVLTRAATETGRTLNWRINVTSFDAACAMVAAGLGVGIVPRAANFAVHPLVVARLHRAERRMGATSVVPVHASQRAAALGRAAAVRTPARSKANIVIAEKDPADATTAQRAQLRVARGSRDGGPAARARATVAEIRHRVLATRRSICTRCSDARRRACWRSASARVKRCSSSPRRIRRSTASASKCIGPASDICCSAQQAATLRNLRVICHDAVEVLQHQLAPASIDPRAHLLSRSVAEEATSQAPADPAPVRRIAGENDRARRHAATRDRLGAVCTADARGHRRVAGVRKRRSRRRFRRAICRAHAHAFRASRSTSRSRRMGSRISKSELTQLSSTRVRVTNA